MAIIIGTNRYFYDVILALAIQYSASRLWLLGSQARLSQCATGSLRYVAVFTYNAK